ncbi:MAG: serine hydroxymethyltransferase [Thaumarchaeota archaeon]|jgi:glycine hydroxymethyltransferase|nr:serine hydroxymethyltransferase [Candidatus Geocrenenecus arthurdayi]MCL7390946.1 serine hydroxymethyltransferase [Candidatus Geocrenenecus arthurdayi]MCL7397087.1 serine hydroxymethyltransferase [Candidatus Geocrenenecus arthurdayi]MCL7403295.1 serine hydroxymethyltransferase [Candidatus Geocrenenecus arthurdayi]
MSRELKNAWKLIKAHESYRRKTLNLIPSENILSPKALKALSTDLAGRYALKPEFYGGTKYIHELWTYAEELTRKLFNVEYVLLEPLSGHVAAILVSHTFAKGGRLATLPAEDGGYPGYEKTKIPDLIGAELIELPSSQEYYTPIVEDSMRVIEERKPELVILGGSIILFPHPVKEFSEIVHSYGGILAYDASHILGLIAGRVFQDPLREGADLVYASTHKTFPGPQGAIVLTNSFDVYEKLSENIYHKIVDNIHLNRLAAYAVTVEEMLRYGMVYAKKVVENAKHLASSLDSLGVPLKAKDRGYTESHQIILDIQDSEARVKVRDRLEECGIIADAGVRFGTNEVTRRGMGKREMEKIAKLIHRAIEGEDPKKVKREVRTLLNRFQTLKFC